MDIYWAQSRLDECLSEEMTAKVVQAQTDPSHKPAGDTVMLVYNGQTGELLKTLPAPFSIRLHRRRWLKMLSDSVDIKVSQVRHYGIARCHGLTIDSLGRGSNR